MKDDDFQLVIINDDMGDRALLRESLLSGSSRTFHFIEARTGQEGIIACHAQSVPRPDCVIVDLHLPDMTGLEVLARLKDDVGDAMFPVVIFIDAGDECRAAAEALKAGAHDYIAKSWLTPDGLACTVENAVVRLAMAKRLRAQQIALDRRESEFKALVENAPEIIARFDTGFRHIYVNPAVERATGVRAEHFLGKSGREMGMDAELCDLWESKFQEVVDERREVVFVFDHDTPEGRRSFQTRLVPEYSATGEVGSILGISTDITEQRRAELALKAAEKRKNEFLAILAHELRNPLAAIRSAAHLLKLKSSGDPDLIWGRDVIARQVKQLTQLIDDLLDVSRIDRGKIQLRRVPLDVNEVVARAAEAVRPLITTKQHALNVVLPPHALHALADPVRLEQVVGNLLANAVKYTDNGGSITLTCAREGAFVVVRVRDNGVGIEPELLPQVFDLAYQIPSTRDRYTGGLGIGLSIVKTLVEMHGGSVAASSDGPGRGSEFTIKVPFLGENHGTLRRTSHGGPED